MKQLVECVPNISEGRDQRKIKISQIVEEIDEQLLNVDPGKATNRTYWSMSPTSNRCYFC